MTSRAIDDLLRSLGNVDAAPDAWAELSRRYRAGQATPAGRAFTDAHARAYAVGRAPATASAVAAVLGEVTDRVAGWSPATMIDVGAGLGTASWVASVVVPSLVDIGLVERSEAMIELGQELAARSSGPSSVARRWRRGDVADLGDDRADVVLASYVLSELEPAASAAAVDVWWAATAGELVLVDAGTPAGYARVPAARGQLLEAGASIVAPCPSAGPCPMMGSNWCHFSVRLARSETHRRVKGADLPFEDEKFAYLVVSRSSPARAAGRVVRHPQVRSGHVRLQVCHDDLLTEVVVGKSRGEVYRWARKAKWGDATPDEVIDRG